VTSMLADRAIAGIAACASKERSRQSRRFRAIGSGAWACGNVLGRSECRCITSCATCSTAASTFRQDARGDPFPCCGLQTKAAADALDRIARVLSSESAAGGLFDLAAKLERPTSLRDLGSMIELGTKPCASRCPHRFPAGRRSSNTRAA